MMVEAPEPAARLTQSQGLALQPFEILTAEVLNKSSIAARDGRGLNQRDGEK
jgi:hypothetical protein